ncbi:MAG: NAD(P)/FAD-dependent oxidoreductase [Proteobacteria bacterium]|nr:NAD(P)/FAD-dependent oxidoreductase [Pseudomonadota bacterium]
MNAAPNAPGAFDALIIGAGVNGLTAAANLARHRKRVLVLEARNKIGGRCETVTLGDSFSAPSVAHLLYALDPSVVSEFRLTHHGLKFAARDVPLVGLRADGKHLVLGRDRHAAVRSIAAHSQADAEAWPKFQRELFELGRVMRSHWWDASPFELPLPAAIKHLKVISLAAWLDSWFESDALKALLAFDASEGGCSPLDAGSAPELVWRASQEMSGRQGAVAFASGGPATLAQALFEAAQAAGAEVRTGARVEALLVTEGTISGARLSSGEIIAAPLVLSSLNRGESLALTPPGAGGFAHMAQANLAKPAVASAQLLLALDHLPPFGGVTVPLNARFVAAERLETFIAAHASARAGKIADELPFEFIAPSAFDAALAPVGQHVVSVLIRPLPVEGCENRREELLSKIVATLDRFAFGLSKHIVHKELLTPENIAERYGSPSGPGHVLRSWDLRVRTSIPGLMLCGADAEPIGAVSGRVGRVAAAFALAEVPR